MSRDALKSSKARVAYPFKIPPITNKSCKEVIMQQMGGDGPWGGVGWGAFNILAKMSKKSCVSSRCPHT